MIDKTNISVTYEAALITIDELHADTKLLNEIFTKLADNEINIDMISQTPPFSGDISLSFSLPSKDVFEAMKILNYLNKEYPNINIQVDANSTKISVSGEYMKITAGIAAKVFKALSDADVGIKMISTSEIDISLLIFDKDVDVALKALEKAFNGNL